MDNITIAPPLLAELEASTEPLPRKLWPTMGGCQDDPVQLKAPHVDLFNKLHREDQMAVDKLKEGVDSFAKDQDKLEALIGAAHAA